MNNFVDWGDWIIDKFPICSDDTVDSRFTEETFFRVHQMVSDAGPEHKQPIF